MGFARTCSVALVGVEGVVVEVQADLEPGRRRLHPGGAARQEPDARAGTGSGPRWSTPGARLAAEEAHGRAQPGRRCPRAAAGSTSPWPARCSGAAERIDPRAHRRPRDDRRAGPRRPGAAGARASCPAVLAAADAGIPAGGRAGAAPRPRRRWCPDVSVLGVRSLRQLIAVLTDEPVPEEEPDEHGRPDPLLAGLRMPGTGAAHRACTAGRRGGRRRPRPGRRRRASARRARALEVAAAGRPPPLPRRARRARARPCSPSGCPGCCRR